MAEINLLEIAKDLNMSITTDFVNPNIMEIYKKSSAFTDYFFDKASEILLKHDIQTYDGKTYKKNVKYFQRERLSIDLVVWESAYDKFDYKSADKVRNVEFARYIWKYLLLVEHENDGEDWLHELQKLCMTSSPYKLLITYGRRDQNNAFPATKKNKGVRVLDRANEIVNFVGNYSFKDFVIMFGEETNNLDDVLSANELIYDIYKYDVKARKFVKQ